MNNNEVNIRCAGGWAAKLGPKVLEKALTKLPEGFKDKNLLVGFDTSDDCAVYKIDEKTSIVQTLDFFPPMISDPYVFGQIAATNALSDVYAMGSKPITALNIVCFPPELDPDILGQILKGGAEKVKEANCSLCGGHSISDDSIKYGLSVTGIVDTDKFLKNNGSKVGDKLIITKPLGVGICLTAYNNGIATEEDYQKCIKSMTTLNKYAAEVLTKYKISALTDVTGFGLGIHLKEMLNENTSAEIYIDEVPLVSNNIKDYIEKEMITGAASRNVTAIKDQLEILSKIGYKEELIYDPQTSGGLLCAIDKEDADKAIIELKNIGVDCAIIGTITTKRNKRITII